MNLLEKMNYAIDYVEQHITDEIDLTKIAQLACCSTYNFQRMFSFIADISIVEYIRRRRLTMAALELQQSNIKVIDLAFKYGYESPVSFTRAFQSMHGITPTAARNPNVSLKAFSRISFQITIKGVNEMNYRIVKTEPFKVFGLEGIVSTVNDSKYFPHVGAIWQENHKNGKYEQLFLDAGESKHILYETMFINSMCRIHGLMNYKKIDDTTYGYMQCSFVTPESKTEGYEIYELPQTTWVVFPMDIPDWDVGGAMNILNKRFYSEWLPISEYEKADGPEFEMYGGSPKKGYIELWMPIVKKVKN
ncbi:MAG: transcriptional regulator, AraC family [Clostridia bacterium]|nr:transcriptional regulator, AraC family [Clostridia bacterium]